jgi:hypothetical protein
LRPIQFALINPLNMCCCVAHFSTAGAELNRNLDPNSPAVAAALLQVFAKFDTSMEQLEPLSAELNVKALPVFRFYKVRKLNPEPYLACNMFCRCCLLAVC